MVSDIFLHLRRGNPNLVGNRGEKWSYQMLQDYHPLCKKEYYLEALSHFDESKNVIVLSDTIDWCKRQDWLQDDRFLLSDSSYEVFDDGASVPYIDLCLMSLCSGGIIANSSMSWWGAWLQNDTEVKLLLLILGMVQRHITMVMQNFVMQTSFQKDGLNFTTTQHRLIL